jgi:DNA recombination-dependent growth factor C
VKAIKAFAPYKLSDQKFFEWCRTASKSSRVMSVLEHFLAKDPASFAYESLGLMPPFESDRPVHDLDGAAYLLCYQYNQRILPGAVRDEKLKVRIAELAEREGREVTKTEYAQLRNEVEKELLPQAFIRRTYIPVLVYKDLLLICHTSVKRQEDIIDHLCRLFGVRNISTTIELFFTNNDIDTTLKTVAIDGSSDQNVGESYFEASDAAVLKGSDKRTMRIKDRNVSHAEVQNALVNGSYSVIELRMDWNTEDGDTLMTFNLTDKFIVKSIKMAETVELKSAEDLHATYYIYAQQFKALVPDIIDLLGGESSPPAGDDDDEL